MAQDMRLARALEAFGSHLAGRGSEYERNKILAAREQEAEQERALMRDERRQKALVTDMYAGYQLMAQGNVAAADKLLANREEQIAKLGGNPRHTQAVRQMIASGDAKGAMQEILPLISGGAAKGWVPAVNAGPEFLGAKDGQATWRDGNRVYAQAVEGYQASPNGQDTKFGAAQDVFKDEAGNLFIGTSKRSGSVFSGVVAPYGHSNEQVGSLELVNDMGLSADQIPGHKAGVTRATEDAKNAASTAQKMFERLPGVRGNIARMQRVIKAIDDGANTGTVMKRLPSFTAASKELDQLQKELGLDVLQNTTFGSLSKDELTFALDSALPQNMDAPELRQWAVDKMSAQNKLYNYISDAAMFLSQPGNTVSKWMESQKGRSDAYGVETGTVKNWEDL